MLSPSVSSATMLSAYSGTEMKKERSSRRTPHEPVRFVFVLCALLCLYRAHNQAAPPPCHSDPLR